MINFRVLITLISNTSWKSPQAVAAKIATLISGSKDENCSISLRFAFKRLTPGRAL